MRSSAERQALTGLWGLRSRLPRMTCRDCRAVREPRAVLAWLDRDGDRLSVRDPAVLELVGLTAVAAVELRLDGLDRRLVLMVAEGEDCRLIEEPGEVVDGRCIRVLRRRFVCRRLALGSRFLHMLTVGCPREPRNCLLPSFAAVERFLTRFAARAPRRWIKSSVTCHDFYHLHP